MRSGLKSAGFKVVPEDSDAYDAILFLDLKETIGEKSPWVATFGNFTNFTYHLKLCDRADNVLFEREISYITPMARPAQFQTVYEYSLALFESDPYINKKYSGKIIATNFGVGDEVSVLISALKDSTEKVRWHAARDLGEIGNARAAEPLVQVLKNRSEYEGVQETAVHALVKIGAGAVKPLIDALKDKDEDWEVRRKAAEVLVEIGDERAVEPLIENLKDEEWHVRTYSARALGDIGYERAVEPLIETLKDEECGVRANAAEALGKIGDARAVEPLIEVLKDEVWHTREMAADALGEIGDERAVEPLIEALKDEESRVRGAAKEALNKIQGK